MPAVRVKTSPRKSESTLSEYSNQKYDKVKKTPKNIESETKYVTGLKIKCKMRLKKLRRGCWKDLTRTACWLPYFTMYFLGSFPASISFRIFGSSF